MRNLSTLISSKDMTWETPQDFFDELNKEFNFTLDPCATPQTAKCRKYFTEKENGLVQDWGGHRVFCNPPYGSAIKHWVRECAEEAQRPKTIVVMLIPARTDTTYFHQYIYKKAEIRFIKGRLKFNGTKKVVVLLHSQVVL